MSLIKNKRTMSQEKEEFMRVRELLLDAESTHNLELTRDNRIYYTPLEYKFKNVIQSNFGSCINLKRRSK